MRIWVLAFLTACCTASAAAVLAADAPGGYTVDPARSRLEITGVKSRGLIVATFKKFSATVNFAPGALADSKCDVVIDMSSIDSQDAERDAGLRGPDLFDAAQFPTAHFACRSFVLSERGFKVFGSLTLHGVTKDLVVFFNFANGEEGPTIEGNAKIKRLEFGVGQGEWKGFQVLADAVVIKFKLLLTAKK